MSTAERPRLDGARVGGRAWHPPVGRGRPIGLMFVLLLIFGFAHALAAGATPARDVVLTATLDLENPGTEVVSEQIVRVTLPADIANQQKVLSVGLPMEGNFRWRRHGNQVDRFLEGRVRLAPGATTRLQIHADIRLMPFNYKVDEGDTQTEGNLNFLRPTAYVESAASEVLALSARIALANPLAEDKLLAAFRYPQHALKYRRGIENRGALFGLRNGYGDCTEYAAIFVAAARAMGFPARLTSEFNFDDGGTYEQPNHHAAEVFLGGRWIPVDPNLATDPASPYGFGTTGTHKIVLKRDGSWVWSTTSRGVSGARADSIVRARITWSVQVR